MSNELTLQDKRFSILDIRMDSKRFPRLSTYKRDDAIFHMTKIVSQAFLYRGQASDPANVNFIATSLVDELLQEERYGARHLSFEEIARIVKDAVLNDPDMFGVSVASLYRVILNWCKGEGCRIQQQANELYRQREAEALRNSVIAPMIQAYTGKLIRNNKIK